MFPFRNSGTLSFQNPNYVEEEENMVENLINWGDIGSEGLESMNTNLNSINRGNRRGRGRGQRQRRGRGRGQNSSYDPNNESGPSNNCEDDEQKRKSIHREVERQRRQEMTNLYSALRSQIPDQYIQGKRSTSDHVAEAANYIKDLEKNIKELSIRRDELKATPEWSNHRPTYEVGGSSSNPKPRPGSVVINPCLGGIAINIDVGYHDQTFSLSSALQLLFEEGLSVSSCTSTKINDRIVHDIICEVMDITSINFSRLQQRMINLVS